MYGSGQPYIGGLTLSQVVRLMRCWLWSQLESTVCVHTHGSNQSSIASWHAIEIM